MYGPGIRVIENLTLCSRKSKLFFMDAGKRISVLVDEAVITADLPPSVVSIFRAAFVEHFDTTTIMVSRDYKALAAKLYSMRDEVQYAIFGLSYPDCEYMYFLIRAEDLKAQSVLRKVVAGFKASLSFQKSEDIGEFVYRVSTAHKTLQELLDDCVRSKRTSHADATDKEADLPSMEELQIFYECGRKHKYVSLDEAETSLESGNQVYQCHWCKSWHQGHPPTGMDIPQHIKEGRWMTTYRRKMGV